MRLLSGLTVVGITLLIPLASAYDVASVSALEILTQQVKEATVFVNNLRGCGYLNTTQAINERHPVINGSACTPADDAVSTKLTSLISAHQSCISQLPSPQTDSAVSQNEIIKAFKAYASALYTLFNAMDLAECTYVLTTLSKTYAVQFSGGESLQALYNQILNQVNSDLSSRVQTTAQNIALQTHFGGTKLLARQMGGAQLLSLFACKLITKIVESEGGGPNRGT